MPWVRLDDEFPEHPKVASAGPRAAWLFVCGLCYCNRNLTDGFIPTNIVKSFGGNARTIAKLLAVKLWEAKGDDGYQVHDYEKYQPLREQVLAERAGTRIRVARYRDRNPVSNAVTSPLVTPMYADCNGAPNPNPVPKDETPSSKTQKVDRRVDIDDEFIAEMVERFGDALGGRTGVLERIEEAKAHKAWAGWKDKRAGVRNWLRRDAERTPGRNGPDRKARIALGVDPNTGEEPKWRGA